MRNSHRIILLSGALLAGLALAQQPQGQQQSQPPAAADSTPPAPQASTPRKPPPSRPDSFKPTEEVRADTILTLPSDI